MYNPQPDLGRCIPPVDTNALSQMVQNHPMSRSNATAAHVQPVWSHGGPYFAGNFPQIPPTTQFPPQSALPKTTNNMSKLSGEALGSQYLSHPKLHGAQSLPNQPVPDIHRVANLPVSCQGGPSQPVFPGFPLQPSSYAADHAKQMAAEYAEKMSKLSRRLEGKLTECAVGFDLSRDQEAKEEENPLCVVAAQAYHEVTRKLASHSNSAVGVSTSRDPVTTLVEKIKMEDAKASCAMAASTSQVSNPSLMPSSSMQHAGMSSSQAGTASSSKRPAASTATHPAPPPTLSPAPKLQTASTQTKPLVKEEVAVPPKKRAKALSTEVGDKPTKKRFHCEQCTKNFSSKWHLDRHVYTHDGKKPVAAPKRKCDQCDKSFSSDFLLERHVERKHSTTDKFTCDVCDKSYADKFHFDRHYKGHFINRPYSCEECGQSFTRRDKQKRHMMIHTGEKPHVCEVCDKAFARKDKLRRHAFTHTPDKPYACSICDLQFNRKDRRDIHEKAHSDPEQKDTGTESKAKPKSKESKAKDKPKSGDSKKTPTKE